MRDPQEPNDSTMSPSVAGELAADPEMEARTQLSAETRDLLPSPGDRSPAPSVDLPVIPGYEVLREIGRGGMGVVYQARDVKLNRLVALKMILVGAHARPETLARFQAEAEAIARLQHPHIVQIYEVGAHEGLPHLSLEFVEGSLDRKLKGTPQPEREAAGLIETLGRAVHYAHGCGVIHRDLKPANVLLTADGTPKITDFGLAKRLYGEPGALTPAEQTQTGAIMGTPSYMAPEMAAGRSKDVSPATDVYALGAILYELLTGRPPFKAESVLETARQVLDEEPVRPTRLRPKLARDLETICLKCLQKTPAKRYPSAEALSEDLRRFLSGAPIQARPVGKLERAWRWCRRQPATASLVAVSIVAALGLVAGILWHSARLNYALKDTQVQRDKARERSLLARDAVDEMLTEVGQERLKDIPEMEPVRKALLEKALAFYQKFLNEQSNDPDLRQETGKAYRRVGDINLLLGRHEDAEAAYRKALALQSQLAEEFRSDAKHRQELAACHDGLAKLHYAVGRLTDAEAQQLAALKLWEQLDRELPNDPKLQSGQAASHNHLGILHRDRGQLDQAEEAYGKSREIWDRLAGEHPNVAEYQHRVAASHNNLALVYRDRGQLNRAEEAYGKALESWEDLIVKHPGVAEYQDALGVGYNGQGFLYHQHLGRLSQAQAPYEKCLQIRERLARAHPAVVGYQVKLAQAQQTMGWLYTDLEQHDQAADALHKALAIREALARDYPKVLLHQRELANILHGLAWFFQTIRKAEQAEDAYAKVLAIRQRLADHGERVPEDQRLLAQTYHEVGLLQQSNNQLPQAKEAYQAALQLREQLVREHPKVPKHQEDLAWSHNNLGTVHTLMGEAAKGEAAHDQALALWEKLAGDHPKVLRYALGLGVSYLNKAKRLATAGKPEAALEWHARAMEQFEAVRKQEARHEEARQRLGGAHAERARVLGQLKRHREALQDWQRAVELGKGPERDRGRSGRALTLARLGEHTRAVAEASDLASRELAGADLLYQSACVYSLSSVGVRRDAQLSEAEREKLGEQYAIRAVELLEKARSAGFFTPAGRLDMLQSDEDLAPVRSRADFARLLAEVGVK